MDLQHQLEQLDQSIEELKEERSRVMQAMKFEKQEVEANRLAELHKYIERIVSLHSGLRYDFEYEAFYYKKDHEQFEYAFSLDCTIEDLKTVERKIDNLIYLYSVVLSQFDHDEDRSYEEDQVKVDLTDFNLTAEFRFKDENSLEIEIEYRKENYLFELSLDETTQLKVVSSDDADLYLSDKRLVYLDTDDAVEVMKDMIENVMNYRERLVH